MLKAWNIREGTCVQTISIKFPTSVLGRTPEYGQFPIYFHNGTNSSVLLLTASDYLALLKISTGETSPPHSQLTTCVYSPQLHRVSTLFV